MKKATNTKQNTTAKTTKTDTAGNLALEETVVPSIPINTNRQRPDPTHVKSYLNGGLKVDDEVTICLLPLNMLTVDTEHYQRPRVDRVHAIARNWRSHKAKVISVNYSDGYLNVTDGQTRAAAAIEAGHECIPCSVTVGKDLEWEIDAFITQDENVTKISAYDLFYARWHKKTDVAAHELKKLMDKFHIVYENPNAGKLIGTRMVPRKPGSRQSGRMTAMVFVMEQADNGNLHLLEAVFQLIRDMEWHTLAGAYSDMFMSAMVSAYRDRDIEKVYRCFTAAFKNQTPVSVMNKARVTFDKVGPRAALTAYLNSFLIGL